MSASYGWQIVRPPVPDASFSTTIAGVLVEHFVGDDHRILLNGEELDESALSFLRGLHAGLPAGPDSVAVRQMIEDIERHGAIRLTVNN